MSDLGELVKDCEGDVLAAVSKLDMKRVTAARVRSKELYDLGLVKVAQEIADKADFKWRMARVAEGKYIPIKTKKIRAFLEKRAEEYNRGRGAAKSPGDLYQMSVESLRQSIRALEQQHPGSIYGLGALGVGSLGGAFRHQQYSQSIRVSAPDSSDYVLYDEFAPPSAWAGADSPLEAITVDHRSVAPGTIGRYRWVEVPVSQYAGLPPQPVLNRLAEEKAKGIFHEYHIGSVEGIKDPLLLGIVKGCEDRWYLSQWGDDVSLDDVI